VTLDLGTVVGLLLTAGGGAFIAAVLKGLSDLRAGARAGQREAVADLIEWRDDLERQVRQASADRDFWRAVCADRGYQLRQAGIEPRTADPVPPSERPGRPAARRRRRDAD
jgi:hypothetical protein